MSQHLILQVGDHILFRQESAEELTDIDLRDGLHIGDHLLRRVVYISSGSPSRYITSGLYEDGTEALWEHRILSQRYVDRFATKVEPDEPIPATPTTPLA